MLGCWDTVPTMPRERHHAYPLPAHFITCLILLLLHLAAVSTQAVDVAPRITDREIVALFGSIAWDRRDHVQAHGRPAGTH